MYNNSNGNNNNNQPRQVYGQNSFLRQASGAPQQYPPAAGRDPTPSAGQENLRGLQPPIGHIDPAPYAQDSHPKAQIYYCDCGVPSAIRQVKNPTSKVYGKWFACCSKPQGQQCGYKNWNIPSHGAAVTNNNQQTPGKTYAPMGPRLEAVEHDMRQFDYVTTELDSTIRGLIRLLMDDNKSLSREVFVAQLSELLGRHEKSMATMPQEPNGNNMEI